MRKLFSVSHCKELFLKPFIDLIEKSYDLFPIFSKEITKSTHYLFLLFRFELRYVSQGHLYYILFFKSCQYLIQKKFIFSLRKYFPKNFSQKYALCCRFSATNATFRSIGRRLSTKKHTERRITIKELSSKEKLFCTYYSLGRSAKEAAAKSGYIFPEKSGLKLLKREDIKNEIERNTQQRKSEQQNISEGYYRLAFGCISDAIKLLFTDEIDPGQIEQMDLFNISEIKKKKGGDIEVKFFDRLKALEKLQNITSSADTDENSFYSAIEKSASALRENDLE